MMTTSTESIHHAPEHESVPADGIETVSARATQAPVESNEPAPVGSAPQEPATGEACLGQRLRAARLARGMSCEDAAHRLKLPVTVVQALEAEQYERIGYSVYLRGYLSKYLSLLELPQILADRVIAAHVEPPPLTTSGRVSKPQFLFNRYSVSALYLILTGIIIVPAVLLAMRTGFDANLARIAPLDAPESIATPAPAGTSTHAKSAVAAAMPLAAMSTPIATATSATNADAPLIASMTPFPSAKALAGDVASDDKTQPIAAPTMKSVAGANHLRLSLTQPSWVEVTTGGGEKLEYGLLPAGTVRNYASAKTLDVRLGNCDGVRVEVDGKAQNLTPYRRANVASFMVANGVSAGLHSGG